jgi:hypothetical protein
MRFLPVNVLREAPIDQIAFAAATDHSLAGADRCAVALARWSCHFRPSADGFRLAQRIIPLTTPVNEPVELIIPCPGVDRIRRHYCR